MTMIKICGLREPGTLSAAVEAGANFVGFVFYPPSPRAITPEGAAALAAKIPDSVQNVALFVNPDDAAIGEVLACTKINMIQLHGSENPERVAVIRKKFGLPVIKAIPVGGADDLKDIAGFESEADWLLFDARPAPASLPGGTGKSFDWTLLEGQTFKKPWMLSGGLTAQTVPGALQRLAPDAVDVSSGVEGVRGQKDAEKIRAFISAVRTAL